jgi:hypothetical protein
MRKKFYILIISLISLISVSTAFIPIHLSQAKKKSNNPDSIQMVKNHPEAGYIEEIGK